MRTFDVEFIRRVMTHPRIWPHISDDTGDPDGFQPVLHDKIFYLAPEHEGVPVGVFLYHPHSTVLFEVHTCVLPEFWGEPALLAARAGLKWMVDNTRCRKVITHVPESNRHARRFAREVGMHDEGTNRESYLKGGKLVDQHVLGITFREIEECQRQR